ncbi:amidohydrolase family protein [Draconibacterium sp.]|nr:amidohydrolase family protein [Draconibacterium sp.]
MKKIKFTLILALITLLLNAQVSIKESPAVGFEQRIRNHIDQQKVIDTHEHLMNPKGIPNSGMFDFMLLFHHYADDDIKSSGMSKPMFNTLLTDSLSVLQKWEIMKPFWEKSFNTAYNRVVSLTAHKLFGIKDINENTVVELSNKIQKAYQSDWFHTVLKDKCNIEYVINDSGDRSFGDQSMFRYTKRFGYFQIDSKAEIEKIAKNQKIQISSLNDLEKSLESEFKKAVEKGFLTVKVGIAYSRILYFEDVQKSQAEKVFNFIYQNENNDFSFNEVKPLSDYMMHRIIELAGKYNKPIQIHTGLQAGDGNYIENSNPTHLANLFLQYRDVNFILFHGGYPFGGELASLAKNFRNVYIDMCWLYIISPSYSERYLHEWLETVPANKIMGFGGDYHNVENVYGHLLFAKEIIGNVLIEKVENGYLSEPEALKIASMLLHDNALNFFQLKK